ncbi:zinc finger protein 830 [Marchantia polymorpha subsp. ruderalis]|uniref:Zinc finger protein 830 n=2 Tax=Marchantia polymorpha TaxID=3197 RepID=A0A176VDJ1_MARPO|nr:hypothetical protein AXG93_2482s1000 [Marchantia polymorpha subsp. ruderalis]PTQ39723.1 hypothetical protein MARPO_0044s0136 [Marchantia polymorpha]BBN07377.1 hypothetical protein Mp_4g03370 [Marchantia polymorpha subsp. ruderalis]|eukprot:PTQ39723.1 hypothetical protein MARPO_0044s0136 [Marchantia polymorpha]
MDAKAALKLRMREAVQKRGKRIESPLVRYNDLGQPVCKVCNVTVKSETLWTAHIASRPHKAAVDDLKAKAASQSAPKAPEPPRAPAAVARPSSTLPDDFFDTAEPKRPKQGAVIESPKPPGAKQSGESKSHRGHSARNGVQSVRPPTQVVAQESDNQSSKESPAAAKGFLPEGFFDSVDADHRARGLEPPKLDPKDEYKEFQKLIKDDMLDVDVRLEEEEAEAAEEREEREQLEQRTLFERIERIKQRQQEKLAAAEQAKTNEEDKADESGNESSDDESEEEEEEDAFYVDWRAKTL